MMIKRCNIVPQIKVAKMRTVQQISIDLSQFSYLSSQPSLHSADNGVSRLCFIVINAIRRVSIKIKTGLHKFANKKKSKFQTCGPNFLLEIYQSLNTATVVKRERKEVNQTF